MKSTDDLELPVRVKGGQSGFTLLEVLVAIVIFSVGMLAMLGLLTNSLIFTGSAGHRSTASQLSYAMAEYVRGNPTSLASYNDPSSSAITAGCFTSAGCAPAQLVQSEYGNWQQRIAETLPSGTGMICRDSSPMDGDGVNWECDDAANAPFVVKICWRETAIGGGMLCSRTVI
jgi:type IV pilus assembly protein PilV